MLSALGGCAGSVGDAGQPSLWLGWVAGGILGLGWLVLHQVAAGYPANHRPGLRRLGNDLQLLTIACTIGVLVARSQLRTDQCGHTVGSAATWEGWLFLAGLAAVMIGVVLAHPGSGWIAPAAVVVGDAGTLVVVLGLHPATLRPEAAMLLGVHGSCTAVATWWARQLRASPPPLRAKAAETSRVLAGSWLILILLLITGGRRIDQLLPESGLVALFVATGISLVLGTGYTRYVETRHDPAWKRPDADRITHIAQRVSGVARRGPAWAVRYHEHW